MDRERRAEPARGGDADAADDDALHPAVVRWLADYARAAPDERDAVVAAILEALDAALKRPERPGGDTPAGDSPD